MRQSAAASRRSRGGRGSVDRRLEVAPVAAVGDGREREAPVGELEAHGAVLNHRTARAVDGAGPGRGPAAHPHGLGGRELHLGVDPDVAHGRARLEAASVARIRPHHPARDRAGRLEVARRHVVVAELVDRDRADRDPRRGVVPRPEDPEPARDVAAHAHHARPARAAVRTARAAVGRVGVDVDAAAAAVGLARARAGAGHGVHAPAGAADPARGRAVRATRAAVVVVHLQVDARAGARGHAAALAGAGCRADTRHAARRARASPAAGPAVGGVVGQVDAGARAVGGGRGARERAGPAVAGAGPAGLAPVARAVTAARGGLCDARAREAHAVAARATRPAVVHVEVGVGLAAVRGVAVAVRGARRAGHRARAAVGRARVARLARLAAAVAAGGTRGGVRRAAAGDTGEPGVAPGPAAPAVGVVGVEVGLAAVAVVPVAVRGGGVAGEGRGRGDVGAGADAADAGLTRAADGAAGAAVVLVVAGAGALAVAGGLAGGAGDGRGGVGPARVVGGAARGGEGEREEQGVGVVAHGVQFSRCRWCRWVSRSYPVLNHSLVEARLATLLSEIHLDRSNLSRFKRHLEETCERSALSGGAMSA